MPRFGGMPSAWGRGVWRTWALGYPAIGVARGRSNRPGARDPGARSGAGRSTESHSSTGAEALVRQLEVLGVDVVFGIPGVHNLAIFEALRRSAIRTLIVRHEQTAVYAADGYYRATGRLGVAVTTTGPGAANTAAAMGEALASRSRLLHLATQIESRLLAGRGGRGSLHESPNQRALMEAVSVWAATVARAEAIPSMVARAAIEAGSGRGGPVFLEIPHDFLEASVRWDARPPVIGRISPPDADQIARAAAVLGAARNPVVWAGGGANTGDAQDALRRVAEALDAPVVTTYSGKGVLAPGHPLSVVFPPHEPAVTKLIGSSDAMLIVGSDLDSMDTQGWRLRLPRPRVSVNAVAEDARRNYAADVVVDAGARPALEVLLEALPPTRRRRNGARRAERAREEANSALRADPVTSPAYRFVMTVSATLPADAFVLADMCVAGYWYAGYAPVAGPRCLAYPVGWGTLGFALPAAVGAAVKGRRTLVVCGDAGLLFGVGELATAVQEGLPIAVLVVNDEGYGMLRFDEKERFGDTFATDLRTPDLVAMAESFGVPAKRCGRRDLAGALRWALSQDGPALVELRTSFPPPATTSPRWPLRGRKEARP